MPIDAARPYLVKGDKTVLRPGMTFSNEPTICIYGEFGVRLEDHMVPSRPIRSTTRLGWRGKNETVIDSALERSVIGKRSPGRYALTN